MPDLLPDQLRLMADTHPDEVAFIDVSAGAELTFAQWDNRSSRLARWLIGHGVSKGDRVALFVPPAEPELFIVGYAAVHKAGAVAVPTSTRLVARELAYVADHAGAVVAITGSSTLPALLQAAPEVGDLHTIVTSADVEAVRGDGGSGRSGEVELVAWDDATDPDDSPIQVPLEGTDMADIMYTSGTTGRPKGVVVRHGNIALLPNGLPPWSGNGWLNASPLFTFAGIAAVYNPMKLGMRLLYQPRFDVDGWFDVVARYRPSATFLVPAMAELLIASPRFAEADLSSITLCPLGSAPLAQSTFDTLRRRLPQAVVSNAWGMTEAGPAFCHMPPEELEHRIGSVGKPVPPTEARIIGDGGEDLPPRTVGQLLIRNPGREREYYRNEAATADTWKDGWLHTGDMAELDEDGYLYLRGRAKDVIIRGGNNVHAADVESALYEHPDVQEAAVAAVPHDVLGEDIGAWVVLRPGATTTEEDLREHSAARLSDYKVPRHWWFIDELPRNPTGKVVKADLPHG
ncbi:MAG: class I adenylate-forming enzyme family protein [Microthrixaceae bacterium]